MSALAAARTAPATVGARDEDPLMHILLAEDDPRVAQYVTRGFTEAGHVVDALADGRQAMIQALQGDYDILVLDRMMPGMDGMAMLKSLRASGDRTPAIFLTAVSGVDDRVEGLEAGADDYLTKPFAFSELMARVNALARRPTATTGETTKLAVHDLELDLLSRAARRGDVEIDLQPREFTLLEVLMRNAGRIVSRTMLLEQVWDFHFDPKTSVVETHVSRLRGKIDKPFEVPLLHTVRNLGYSMRPPR